MIYLLFIVLFAQMIMILSLLCKSPLREPLVIGLDGLKRGRAQLVVKSVAATVFVVMMYIIYSAVETHSRSVNSPNHVLLVYHMLEASLMGFSLFLMLMIGSLHPYIKEVTILTEAISAAWKQNQACEESMKKIADTAKSLKENISRLRTEIKRLESECERKEKEVQSRTANSGALKNRLEGFLVEYDGLLADNKDLKDQLRDLNERLSHSSGKRSSFFSWDQWGL